MFSIEDRQRAFEENKVLRQELQSLREDQSSVALLQEKISNYEKILNVEHGTSQSVSKIAARAISDIDGPFVRAILLNSGQNSDLSKGDAVMAPRKFQEIEDPAIVPSVSIDAEADISLQAEDLEKLNAEALNNE